MGDVTVRAALALEELQRAVPKVVAGADALDRPIRWVHAGEVRRMPELLKGGELLLTTGMGIGDDAADQAAFVAELAEHGVAALALEVGGRFASAPPALVAAAEAHGVPLVVLQRETPFVEITEAVHREIVNRQYALLRRADDVHHRFSRLMLDGAGIPEVLAALARTIADPVLIETDRHGVLFHVAGEQADGTVLAAWDAAARDAPDAPDCLAVPIPMGAGEVYGRLVALALDSPLTDLDRIAMEQAVGLVALALLRSRQEELLAARQRGNLLVALLDGQVAEAEARARAEQLGFPTPPAMLAVAVGATRHAGHVASAPSEEAWALLWRDLQREFESHRMPVLHGLRMLQRELLLVVGAQRGRDRGGLADQVAGIVGDVAERRLGAAGALVVSVAGMAGTWAAVREALREATDALPAAAVQPERPWHDATRPGLDRLLFELRDHPALERFVEAQIGPLLAHDAERSAKLLPTLRAYCDHSGRRAETARALHLERQSLYHRIGRIEQLLGVDLRDAETLLQLHLALRAREHLAGAGAVSR